MEQEKEGADLLYGVPAMSTYLGLTEAAVYHLTRREDFPSFKIGGKVCARRTSLNQWLVEQEARARSE